MRTDLNKDKNVGRSGGCPGFVYRIRAVDDKDYLQRGWNGRLKGHVNRRGRELSRQNLVNGGAYRTILPQSFHWDVDVMECASANIHPLVAGLGCW